MKLILVSMIAVLICSSVATAAPSTGQQLGQFGLGVLGGAVGAIVAITVISVGMEQIETRAGRVAAVIGSLTLFSGVGAAAGVLLCRAAPVHDWNTRGMDGVFWDGSIAYSACLRCYTRIWTVAGREDPNCGRLL